MWTALATSVRSLFFPPLCRACGEVLPVQGEEQILCAACTHAVRLVSPPVCARCGAPLNGGQIQEGDIEGCGWCRGRPLAFEAARSAATYEGPLRDLILEFKFKSSYRVRPYLVGVFLAGAERHFGTRRFDAIVPVPLHPLRRFQREFNQAEFLGEILARSWSIPIHAHALRRVGWRPPQSRLSGKWRAANLKKVFRAGTRGVEGHRVLLVDDVMTTGLTLSSCAEILLEAGAASVSAYTLARRLPRERSRTGSDRDKSVE
ncbi:MAG: hypothetical protein GHCLOJNM_02648 [bacterium]|nr:hypothetical protein [bacterium]